MSWTCSSVSVFSPAASSPPWSLLSVLSLLPERRTAVGVDGDSSANKSSACACLRLLQRAFGAMIHQRTHAEMTRMFNMHPVWRLHKTCYFRLDTSFALQATTRLFKQITLQNLYCLKWQTSLSGGKYISVSYMTLNVAALSIVYLDASSLWHGVTPTTTTTTDATSSTSPSYNALS